MSTINTTAFNPAPMPPLSFTPPPAGQAPLPAAPASATGGIPEPGGVSRQVQTPVLSREQQREIFRQKMLQKLQLQARPPKSKGEAAIRNMLDMPAIFLDILISGAAVIAIAVARKMEWTKASPWLWGLSFIPLGFAFRGAYSAVTGRVPSQESAQRTLQDLGPAQAPGNINPPPRPNYQA